MSLGFAASSDQNFALTLTLSPRRGNLISRGMTIAGPKMYEGEPSLFPSLRERVGKSGLDFPAGKRLVAMGD